MPKVKLGRDPATEKRVQIERVSFHTFGGAGEEVPRAATPELRPW